MLEEVVEHRDELQRDKVSKTSSILSISLALTFHITSDCLDLLEAIKRGTILEYKLYRISTSFALNH